MLQVLSSPIEPNEEDKTIEHGEPTGETSTNVTGVVNISHTSPKKYGQKQHVSSVNK